MENFLDSAEYLREIMPVLVQWYRNARRKMPWRESPSPYRTWVSEIMLQQTRVDTVIPYFERFMEALPDIPSLAYCEENRLLKLWEGLGYYSRVRNMKKAALVCMEEYGGKLPEDYGLLQKLPGIGAYTAGAVSSIAFGLKEPVVDGNVLRVISRILAETKDISKDATRKEYTELLRKVLTESDLDPSEFNQSLMELGALVCIPNGAPLCEQCPLNNACQACISGRTSEIPVNSGKIKRKKVDLTVFILTDGNLLAVEKHPEKGLLSALYGLPQTEGHLDFRKALEWLTERGLKKVSLTELPTKKHVFTHVDWQMKAYEVSVDSMELQKTSEEQQWVLTDRNGLLHEIPLAAAYKKWNLF